MVIDITTKQDEYINILKTHFPSAISQLEDGSYIIDKEQLQLMVEPKNCKLIEDGYGIKWVGKKESYHNAYIPNNKILKPNIAESKNFDTTGNVLIKGDNLEVLKLLRKNYFEKIKMIYIDPPYNTQNDGFIYNDNFSKSQDDVLDELGYSAEQSEYIKNIAGAKTHSGWLSFMYPRLLLARDLLQGDGVIFISIDDNEQANLKLLCDEVFGQENFVANLSTVMNLKGNNDEFAFSGTHEYTIVYAKNKKELTLFEFNISSDDLEDWSSDEFGWFKQGANLKSTGVNAPRERRPNLYFPIFIDSNDNIYVTDDNQPPLNFIGDLKIIFPITNNLEMSWRWSKNKFLNEKHNVIISRNGTLGIYKKQRPNLGDIPSKKPKTLFYKPEYSSGNGTSQIKDLFVAKIFSNPKPIQLIRDFLTISTINDDIILDFFAGSGTTGDAVMQLNAEDGCNRKFILVQLAEPIDQIKSSETYNFVTQELKKEPTIFEITAERLRRAGEKILTDNLALGENAKNLCNLDIGFKIYEIGNDEYNAIYDKNFTEITQDELDLAIHDNIRLDSLTILTNLLLGSGVTFDAKVETVIADVAYRVENKLFILQEFELQPELFVGIEYAIVYTRYFTSDSFIINLTSYIDTDKIIIKG